MDLKELRRQIDETDDQILALFVRRMEIVEEVASYKIETGQPVLHPEREKEILARILAEAPVNYQKYAVSLFTELITLSRNLQNSLIEEQKAD